MPARRVGRVIPDLIRQHPELIAQVVLLVAAEVLVLAAVDPAAALRDVLPLGSDHTGHPYNVSELADNLRHLRLTGWAQGWFDGFPTGVLYPVLAPGIAAIGSLVLPLAVAYKLTVAAAPLLLPVCAFLAARMARLPRAYPVLLAVFTLPFLFDVSCNVCGGPIESTMLGEYAYAWGLAFSLLALGATVRLCQASTGQDGITKPGGSRWWPPLLLGLAAIGHPVTALWAALGVLLILGHAWWFQHRPPTRTILPVLLTLLLAAVWWLPFLADRQFMPEPMEYKFQQYLTFLFPATGPWEIALIALAAGGAFWAYRTRQLLLASLVPLTAIMGIAFRFLPQSQLPNWRVIELWYLGIWLLAAAGFLEAVRWLIPRIPLVREKVPDGLVRYAVAGGALVAVSLIQGIPWGLWPGEHLTTTGTVSHERWLGLDFPAVLQSRFAAEVFGGAPASPNAAEYDAMISMLKSVVRRDGCGRLAFDQNLYGGTSRFYDEIDSLPLLTNGCLDTITGTLLDSGSNTPAVFIAEALVSSYPEESMPNLPYPEFNLPVGISYLRQLGVSYYLTHGGTAENAARHQPDLTLVGSTAEVQLWKLSDSALVTPLSNQPAVVTGLAAQKISWLRYSDDYLLSSGWGHIVVTQSGPPDWPRTSPAALPVESPLPPVTISHVSVTDTAISFTVSRTGVPVEVRDSYFPGWQVHGGRGPYRAVPDFMVVVPTSTHVTLVYTTTAIITTAQVLGLIGLLGVIALGVTDRRRRKRAGRVALAPADPVPVAKKVG
jgi:hypothetical protein